MPEQLISINGLPALYDAMKKAGREKEIHDMIKNYLLSTFTADLDKKVDRFLIIDGGLFPADKEYFKLYWELRQLYINGLYYSTVVLAGVLCERMCYDILSKQRISINENNLSEEQISCLYKINLFDLINLLHSWNLIKDDTKREMIEINNNVGIDFLPAA